MDEQPSVPPTPPVTPPVAPIALKSKLPIILIGLVVLLLIGGGGIFLGKQMSKPVVTPMPIEVQPTITADPTANWQTYTDDTVSFKYPLDWKAQAKETFGSRSSVEFKFGANTVLNFTNAGNYNQDTGKAYTSPGDYFLPSPDTAAFQTYQIKNLTVAGQPATLAISAGEPGHVGPFEHAAFFSPDNKSIMDFYYQRDYYSDGKNQLDPENLLDQILSTFKFTNPVDTTGWKTYTSGQVYYSGKVTPIKFSIEYPGDWYVPTPVIQDQLIVSSSPNPGSQSDENFVVFSVSVVADNYSSTSIKQWLIDAEKACIGCAPGPAHFLEETTIGGLPAAKAAAGLPNPYFTNDYNEYSYYVNKGKYLIEMRLEYGPRSFLPKLEKIATTFKFIN